jgi:integral membrane sensor domain MASE1
MPYVAQMGMVALAYFAAARMSLVLAIPPGYATAVWPPSGIALAAALLLGNRVWPGIWIGAALGLLRCAEIQGYFVSKPLPREQITPFLRKNQ